MSEPLKCAHTVVDFVNSATPWPPNLSTISDAFQNYLPTSVDRVDTKKLSQYGLAVYRELMSSCHSAPRIEVTGQKEVTDIIDTILSTVAILRVLAGLPKREYQLMSTTLSLLRILGAQCSGNALTIGGAPFLLPRSMSPESLKNKNFEGSALLLVCASIENDRHSSPDRDDNELGSHTSDVQTQTAPAMHVDGNASDSCMSCTDEEQAYSLGLYSDSNSTKPDQLKEALPTPLDIPLDAHVLPGRGYRLNCFLPAPCVADENNVNALVTAVTYQRYVWRISLPTVGLCLYTFSRSIFARVVVGWIEEAPDGTHLPLVRIVTSDSRFTNDPSSGVFDMLNPLSALLLSQFVLGLGSHVGALYNAQLPSGDCGFSWRADQTDMSSENVTTCCIRPVTAGSDCKGAVASWVRDMSILVDDGKLTSSRETMSSKKEAPQTFQRPQTSGAVASQQSSSNKLTDPALLSPYTQSPQSSLLGSQPPGSSVSTQNKSEAASVIAKKRLKFDMWLALRGTVILAVLGIPVMLEVPLTPFQERVQSMIPTYRAFTEPPDWEDLWPDRPIPIPSDKPYISLRDKLMAQKNQPELTRPQHGLNKHRHASLLQERCESDDIGFEVITSRFTVLMFAVELAQQIHAHYAETQEAGSRQPWDIILHLACCRHDQAYGYSIISGDVLPERSIKLPKPAVSSNARLRSLLEDQREVARKQASAQMIRDRDPTSLQAIAARVDENLKVVPNTSSQETLDAGGIWNDMGPGRAITDIIVSTPLVLTPEPELSTGPNQPPRTTRFKFLHSISGIFKRSARSGKTKSATSSRSPTPIPPDSENIVFLSTLGGEYKRNQNASNVSQAKNQSTIYMVSMLAYLESFELTVIPVFVVAGFDATGTILMAWRDKDTGYNAIFREETKTYDLTSPIEAFLFALAIHRIYRHQIELVKQLENDNPRRQFLLTKLNKNWFVPSSTTNETNDNDGLGQN